MPREDLPIGESETDTVLSGERACPDCGHALEQYADYPPDVRVECTNCGFEDIWVAG